jgi:hypothetical protein
MHMYKFTSSQIIVQVQHSLTITTVENKIAVISFSIICSIYPLRYFYINKAGYIYIYIMNWHNKDALIREISEIHSFADRIYPQMLQCMTSLSLSFTNNICCVIRYTFCHAIERGSMYLFHERNRA